METARTLHRQITTDSRTTSLPIPSLSWLTTLILSTTSRNIPPLPSLLATARLRLLSSDLSTPGLLDPIYVSSHSFPTSLITSGQQHPTTDYPKDQSLPYDILVQVLDIVNLSRSKWEVVEELESIERGEQTRGREVIRLPTTSNSSDPNDPNEGDGVDMGDGGTQTQAAQQQAATAQAQQQAQQVKDRKNATHKITLQDCSGQRLYALELKRIEEIAVPQFVSGKMVGGTPIGCKLLLKKGTKVARGVVLLEPGMVRVLGGRVEGWGRVWEQGRLERMRGEVNGQR